MAGTIDKPPVAHLGAVCDGRQDIIARQLVIPEARKPGSKEAQIRVPRMHGLPKHTLGSTEILVKSGFMSRRSF